MIWNVTRVLWERACLWRQISGQCWIPGLLRDLLWEVQDEKACRAPNGCRPVDAPASPPEVHSPWSPSSLSSLPTSKATHWPSYEYQTSTRAAACANGPQQTELPASASTFKKVQQLLPFSQGKLSSHYFYTKTQRITHVEDDHWCRKSQHKSCLYTSCLKGQRSHLPNTFTIEGKKTNSSDDIR